MYALKDSVSSACFAVWINGYVKQDGQKDMIEKRYSNEHLLIIASDMLWSGNALVSQTVMIWSAQVCLVITLIERLDTQRRPLAKS